MRESARSAKGLDRAVRDAEGIPPARRHRLGRRHGVHAVLPAARRFLAVVAVAVAVIFVCGAAMVAIAWSAASRAGLRFNMPLDWYVMFAVFFIMLAVFVHIRAVVFGRLDAALREQRWADGASALGAIRWEVSANLVLGVFVTVLVRLGGTA